jgi:hypothetical protein
MFMRIFCVIVGLFYFSFMAAQCDHTPTIETEGDFILCPTEVIQIFTQEYDSYQWFKKSFSGTEWEIIPGETSQFLDVIQGVDDLFYFNVATTLNSCSETSSEVLIDSWVFAPMVVESSGNYIFEDNFFNVCLGDSITLNIGMPYDTNIQWYKDGAPIAGENGSSITLTDIEESGVYFVECAPAECPEFIVNPGVELPVLISDCNLNIIDNSQSSKITLYPNPVHDKLIIKNKADKSLTIEFYNVNGKKILKQIVNSGINGFDFSKLAKGIYFAKFNTMDAGFTKIVIKN